MEFGVLGPLEVHDEGQRLVVVPPRVRTVLAILLTRAGCVVSVDRFVDELWGECPPLDARSMVHGYLSRLRRALRNGPGEAAARRLVTRKPGYLLRVEDCELDLRRFERIISEARKAVRDGGPRSGLELFQQAQDLCRGTPFAEVPATPMVAIESSRVTEIQLIAAHERLDAALAAGRHAHAIAELTELVGTHPLRERFAGQLMLALHRAGRTADALEVYGRARARLVGELGLEPGADLRRMHSALLRGTSPPPGPPVAPARTLRGTPASGPRGCVRLRRPYHPDPPD